MLIIDVQIDDSSILLILGMLIVGHIWSFLAKGSELTILIVYQSYFIKCFKLHCSFFNHSNIWLLEI